MARRHVEDGNVTSLGPCIEEAEGFAVARFGLPAFLTRAREEDAPEELVENPAFSTPEEVLEYGYQRLTENIADDIIRKIMSCSPAFFERLVVELMVKMGYGGSLREAAQWTLAMQIVSGIDKM